MSDLQVMFLEAGRQTAEQVAGRLAAFVGQATQTVDLAIYDMHLSGAARDILIGALQERQRAGVAVRICYDLGDDVARSLAQDAQPPTTLTATFLSDTG